MNFLEDETFLQEHFLQKHQSKITTGNGEKLKMAMIKNLVRIHYSATNTEVTYFHDTQHSKIIIRNMTDQYYTRAYQNFRNFTQFLKHLYTYTNTR